MSYIIYIKRKISLEHSHLTEREGVGREGEKGRERGGGRGRERERKREKILLTNLFTHQPVTFPTWLSPSSASFLFFILHSKMNLSFKSICNFFLLVMA